MPPRVVLFSPTMTLPPDSTNKKTVVPMLNPYKKPKLTTHASLPHPGMPGRTGMPTTMTTNHGQPRSDDWVHSYLEREDTAHALRFCQKNKANGTGYTSIRRRQPFVTPPPTPTPSWTPTTTDAPNQLANDLSHLGVEAAIDMPLSTPPETPPEDIFELSPMQSFLTDSLPETTTTFRLSESDVERIVKRVVRCIKTTVEDSVMSFLSLSWSPWWQKSSRN